MNDYIVRKIDVRNDFKIPNADMSETNRNYCYGRKDKTQMEKKNWKKAPNSEEQQGQKVKQKNLKVNDHLYATQKVTKNPEANRYGLKGSVFPTSWTQ